MRSIGAAVVLVQIAFRNLFASKARSLIVGGIVLIGSLVVVVGSAVVDTIDSSMRGSVQGSLAGHLQIYSARSKDE
ncbi:MAG TPA: ABC transporter permease, partial [Anaeromyxobacteraceae bacterium]|nr:ABC transporter permease [Anaeromyxobacteraceae bacterium]